MLLGIKNYQSLLNIDVVGRKNCILYQMGVELSKHL